jgi:hypothetical protein
LGVLTREKLYALDKGYYTRSNTRRKRSSEHNFHSKEYNRSGLWDWETRAITDYFAGCKRLLVLGAGGGREVLALLRLGYSVDGFEPHPDLAVAANELLREAGYSTAVHSIPRDQGPNTETIYDGIIIGWGAYMLIQGRNRRVALLQQLRGQTQAQSPILLSFVGRGSTDQVYKVSTLVANVVRRMLRRGPAEIGDWLLPDYYAHFFTQEEIISELSEGGFETIHCSITGSFYDHAVGRAI